MASKGDNLVGVTSLREVLLAPAEQKLSEVMHKHIIAADEVEDQRDVAQKIAEYNLLALPVVEHDKKIRTSLPSMTQWTSYCLGWEETSQRCLVVK